MWHQDSVATERHWRQWFNCVSRSKGSSFMILWSPKTLWFKPQPPERDRVDLMLPFIFKGLVKLQQSLRDGWLSLFSCSLICFGNQIFINVEESYSGIFQPFSQNACRHRQEGWPVLKNRFAQVPELTPAGETPVCLDCSILPAACEWFISPIQRVLAWAPKYHHWLHGSSRGRPAGERSTPKQLRSSKFAPQWQKPVSLKNILLSDWKTCWKT